MNLVNCLFSFIFSWHIILAQDPGDYDAINVQFRMDPGNMGFPLFPTMGRFFDHAHHSADFSKLENGSDNENSTDAESRVFTEKPDGESNVVYRKTFQIQTPDFHKIVVDTNNQDAECSLLCSLFDGIFHRPKIGTSSSSEVNSSSSENESNEKNSTRDSAKVTIQVQKPKGMKSEELDAEFERVEKTLEHVLHGMEENFNRMFSGSRIPSRRGKNQQSENVNSTQVESSTQEPKTDQEVTEQVQTTEQTTAKSSEPKKMNNDETDAKINEMEKKLAQVLGMVEKLENENGRLKKIVSSMINGT